MEANELLELVRLNMEQHDAMVRNTIAQDAGGLKQFLVEHIDVLA